MEKIKIYSDKKYLTQEEYEPILFPFWGLGLKQEDKQLSSEFDKYIKNGKNYFEMTSIEDCDFVVLPEKYTGKENMQPLIDIAEKYNKPIIIFFINDSAEKIDIKNSYVFRTSFYKKTQRENEFAIPCWTEDFATKYFNKIDVVRKKQNTPIVSYCGYTKTWKDRVKGFLGRDYGVWREIRYRAVNILKKNKKIKTNFIIRNNFSGGAYTSNDIGLSEKDLQKIRLKIRQEYVANLDNGDYALVTRGNGNFSMRLYEVLSMGRIPLFINTDCVLPYEKDIDWKNICVWLEDYEMKNISDKLLYFHNKISDQDFQKLQKEIRETYEEWISPDGFFKNFYKHFSKK